MVLLATMRVLCKCLRELSVLAKLFDNECLLFVYRIIFCFTIQLQRRFHEEIQVPRNWYESYWDSADKVCFDQETLPSQDLATNTLYVHKKHIPMDRFSIVMDILSGVFLRNEISFNLWPSRRKYSIQILAAHDGPLAYWRMLEYLWSWKSLFPSSHSKKSTDHFWFSKHFSY